MRFDRLDALLDANIKAANIKMDEWCGCLVGNYIISDASLPFHFGYLDDVSTASVIISDWKDYPFSLEQHGIIGASYDGTMRFLSEWFEISFYEANLLFGYRSDTEIEPTPTIFGVKVGTNQEGKPALARLAKFIIYKKKKAEIFSDYERARKMGDVGVEAYVEEKVNAELLCVG